MENKLKWIWRVSLHRLRLISTFHQVLLHIKSNSSSGDECKYMVGKQPFRRIFDGQIVLDSDDNARIDNFLNQCEQNNTPMKEWSRAMILRFYQANQFNYAKTLKSMQEYDQWLTTLPPKLDEATKQFLVIAYIWYVEQGRHLHSGPRLPLPTNHRAQSLPHRSQGDTDRAVIARPHILPGVGEGEDAATRTNRELGHHHGPQLHIDRTSASSINDVHIQALK